MRNHCSLAHGDALLSAPICASKRDLFNACSFFVRLVRNIASWTEWFTKFLRKPRQGPDDESERLALEHVVLQSFRTIEAIIGEPGNNATRFHERLAAWGLDPDERVGFPRRRSTGWKSEYGGFRVFVIPELLMAKGGGVLSRCLKLWKRSILRMRYCSDHSGGRPNQWGATETNPR